MLSSVVAAITQTTLHRENVQSIPIAEADAPIITPPRDHNPRSMKNKLRTRPNKSCGVVI